MKFVKVMAMGDGSWLAMSEFWLEAGPPFFTDRTEGLPRVRRIDPNTVCDKSVNYKQIGQNTL